MRVLLACEESGRACEAFRALGHDAYSCDILPTSGNLPQYHLQADCLTVLDQGWDLMIAFPPCTYLSALGARWFHGPGGDDRKQKREEALAFVLAQAHAGGSLRRSSSPIGLATQTARRLAFG